MENMMYQPAVERESVNGIQEVSLCTNAFSNRKMFLFGPIDEKTVYTFTAQMLYLIEDEQSPIDIYINSPGGEVNSGLAIYDLIQSCKAPINMYCSWIFRRGERPFICKNFELDDYLKRKSINRTDFNKENRSYLDRSCIQVCIFDDRIEVISPGMLYGGLDIITAKHGKSTCRNEAIAEAFHYMRIVEAWGTGIPRIISRCKEYNLQEPLFEELGDGFLVTMFRKPTNQTNQSNQTNQLDQPNSVDIEQSQNINIGDLENKIIELLRVQPGVTTKEIMEKLEITNNQVKYYIKKLKDDGIIKRVGTNRKGSWKVM